MLCNSCYATTDPFGDEHPDGVEYVCPICGNEQFEPYDHQDGGDMLMDPSWLPSPEEFEANTVGCIPYDEALETIADMYGGLDQLRSAVAEQSVSIDEAVLQLANRDGFQATVTCFACPVQVEATVDGYDLYFRARSDVWRIDIGRDMDDRAQFDELLFSREGEAETSGSWMEPWEVVKHLSDAIRDFRQQLQARDA